jgi:hypothetical protein
MFSIWSYIANKYLQEILSGKAPGTDDKTLVSPLSELLNYVVNPLARRY